MPARGSPLPSTQLLALDTRGVTQTRARVGGSAWRHAWGAHTGGDGVRAQGVRVPQWVCAHGCAKRTCKELCTHAHGCRCIRSWVHTGGQWGRAGGRRGWLRGGHPELCVGQTGGSFPGLGTRGLCQTRPHGHACRGAGGAGRLRRSGGVKPRRCPWVLGNCSSNSVPDYSGAG